jgi:hypothetical protein
MSVKKTAVITDIVSLGLAIVMTGIMESCVIRKPVQGLFVFMMMNFFLLLNVFIALGMESATTVSAFVRLGTAGTTALNRPAGTTAVIMGSV